MFLDLPKEMAIKKLRAYKHTLCYYSKDEVSRSLRTLSKFNYHQTASVGLAGLQGWADRVERSQWRETA